MAHNGWLWDDMGLCKTERLLPVSSLVASLPRQTHIKEGVRQGLLEGKPQHIKET